MPIETPTYQEIVDRVRADIANALPEVDPTISGSFVNALATSNAGRHYDLALMFQQLLEELFPQTASGEFLERWAQYEGLARFSATASDGYITVTGTVATVIPALTEWRTADNLIFSSIAVGSVSNISASVSSLTRSGYTVTATTSTAHEMATGIEVTISNADFADYNGTFEITVLSQTTFQYTITTTPTTPDTSLTITADFDGASIEVEANEPGVDGNLESGAELQITTPIVGLDDAAFVQYLGLTGGGDEETDDALRERVLYSRANPVANFNESAIILQAMTVAGVTRVWVNRITPYVGAVTVAFVRDDDADLIPDTGEVQDVYDALYEILPAQTDPNDLVVLAPTAVEVDFTFSALSPDTSTMRTAIENNLAAFFLDIAQYETDIDEDKYRSAIINTYDAETGDTLETFTLIDPIPGSDISISTNEIGVLGAVVFP